MSLSDILGSIGVLILLIAFGLNALKLIKNDKAPYFIMNIVGASIAGYSSYMIQFLPFVILEFFWVLVSCWGLYKVVRTPNVPRGKERKNV